MNHKQVSNTLFGCSIASGFQSYLLIEQQLYPNALVTGVIAIFVMWAAWTVFKEREDD